MTNKINLFWYSMSNMEKAPPFFSKNGLYNLIFGVKENYGDILSRYLAQKISSKKVDWYRPNSNSNERNFLSIGSILNYADSKSCIWGSGIIDRKHKIVCEEIRSVRGPLTRDRLLELNFDCPEVYGDPAILLPNYYDPPIEKKFKIGIIPHYVDFKIVKNLFGHNSQIKIIDILTTNIEKTTDEILQCEAIISSSLHGVIISHAYTIPAVWVKFSNNLYGDNVKFYDYFNSTGLFPYEGKMITETLGVKNLKSLFNIHENLPKSENLNKLKEDLMNNCPFV